jgi:phthiocerol/phenolphthiocerol synthesis type-I polyketide synthase E
MSREEVSDEFLQEIFLEGRNIHFPPSMLQLPIMDQMAYLIELGKKNNYLPPDFDLTDALRIAEIWKDNRYAMDTYKTQFYPGKVAYFLATEDHAHEMKDIEEMQRRFISDVECHEAPGKHGTMLAKENAKELAERLARVLSKFDSLSY